jgi:hypothetical protein
LSPEEIAAFLEAVATRRDRVALTTAYATGLRSSEVVGLRVQDIHSSRMVIHVVNGKGSKQRYVMLSPKLLGILRAYWKIERPRHWLFPGRRGKKPLDPTILNAHAQPQLWQRASASAQGEVVLACHPAIGDPHAPEHPVPVLHGRYDSLQGARVIGIAREDFVAERKPIEGHDQRDQHLFAVGAVIPGIPALSERVRFGLTFKVGARDVVEEHIVLDREQLA